MLNIGAQMRPATRRFKGKTYQIAQSLRYLHLEGRGLRVYFANSLVHHQRTITIARRPHNAPPQRDTGPRVNENIRSPEIRLIGAEGENVGLVSPARAMDMAEEAGLDLVEISPNANPPVCKIMDFGKFKYETQKRAPQHRQRRL